MAQTASNVICQLSGAMPRGTASLPRARGLGQASPGRAKSKIIMLPHSFQDTAAPHGLLLLSFHTSALLLCTVLAGDVPRSRTSECMCGASMSQPTEVIKLKSLS